jgi:hypothetical protein
MSEVNTLHCRLICPYITYMVKGSYGKKGKAAIYDGLMRYFISFYG